MKFELLDGGVELPTSSRKRRVEVEVVVDAPVSPPPPKTEPRTLFAEHIDGRICGERKN